MNHVVHTVRTKCETKPDVHASKACPLVKNKLSKSKRSQVHTYDLTSECTCVCTYIHTLHISSKTRWHTYIHLQMQIHTRNQAYVHMYSWFCSNSSITYHLAHVIIVAFFFIKDELNDVLKQQTIWREPTVHAWLLCIHTWLLCIHTYIRTYVHTYISTCVYIMHAYIQYMHTYMHVHI